MGQVEELKLEIATLRKLLKQGAAPAAQCSSQGQETFKQAELPDVVRYPLAEFAVGAGRNIALPTTVQEIADVVGRENAVRIVEGTRPSGSRKWRRQLYVPAEMKETHRISKMIGWDAAAMLAASHGHCIIDIPSCFALRKGYMASHALGMWNNGASIGEISAEMSVTEKTAQQLIDEAEYWRGKLVA